MKLNLSDHAVKELKQFLLQRESDIALDEENFGFLHGVFIAIFNRDPHD